MMWDIRRASDQSGFYGSSKDVSDQFMDHNDVWRLAFCGTWLYTAGGLGVYPYIIKNFPEMVHWFWYWNPSIIVLVNH